MLLIETTEEKTVIQTDSLSLLVKELVKVWSERGDIYIHEHGLLEVDGKAIEYAVPHVTLTVYHDDPEVLATITFGQEPGETYITEMPPETSPRRRVAPGSLKVVGGSHE